MARAYILSGILFGIVPIAISMLGFLGANPALGIALPAGTDPSMIGVLVVSHFLPQWAVAAFIIMLLGGLCATMDWGMCAAGSLFALNLTKLTPAEQAVREKESLGQQLAKEELAVSDALDRKLVLRGRLAMVGITLAGAGVVLAVLYIPGFGLQYLWWVFNTVAACVAAPTILSLYWKRADSKGVFWGVLVAFVVGIPLFVYSNIVGAIWLTVASSIGIVLITVVFALAFPRKISFESASQRRAET